jgi:flagellar basal body-associated protein FliL
LLRHCGLADQVRNDVNNTKRTVPFVLLIQRKVGVAVAGSDEKKKGGKKGKLALALVALLVVVAGSGAGWFFFIKESPDDFVPVKADYYEDEAENGRPAPAPPQNYNPYGPNAKMERLEFKEIIVNLAGSGSSYLRIGVVVEYPVENKKLVEEIKEKEIPLKDTLVTSLRAKTRADVANTDELKTNLLKDLNKNLRFGDFAGIYFTDFLVQ